MLTADNITDEQIREYTREHWRDPWAGGGPGKGTVNDAMIIAFSSTTSFEGARSIRGQFADLINAKAVR